MISIEYGSIGVFWRARETVKELLEAQPGAALAPEYSFGSKVN